MGTDKKELILEIYFYYQKYHKDYPNDIEAIEYNVNNNIEQEIDYCREEYDYIKFNNIKDKERIKIHDDIWERLNYLKGELKYESKK